MRRSKSLRSMWTRSSRHRGRRSRPAVVVLTAACLLGVLYWSGASLFKKRDPVLGLSATVMPPAAAEPATEPEPAPFAEVGEPVPDLIAETRESAGDARLAAQADTELKALRGGDPDILRRRVGTLVLDDRYPPEIRGSWLAEARDLARRVVFSATPMQHATTVTVARGDTLLDICARLQRAEKVAVTPRLIEMVNDVSAARLKAGAKLKIPTEPMSILVDKDEYRLYLLLGGCFLKDYVVGIGREHRTPEGRFKIHSKTKNPQWTDPETGKVWRFGEPGHTIGTRWLSFANESGRTGFGIHGTTDQGSVGRAQSAGCIRMTKDDVEELFDLVPQGAEVVIRR